MSAMSIYGIRRNCMKLFRHASLFANHKSTRPPEIYIMRSAHNNLYQMVKKRTLEARTKLQNNNVPITSEYSSIKKTPYLKTQETYTTAQTINGKDGMTKAKISQNTQLLKGSDCNVKHKTCSVNNASPCKPSSTGYQVPGVCNRDSKGGFFSLYNPKLWLAVFAALGTGGLIFYLLSRNKKDSDANGSKCSPHILSSMDLPKHVPYVLIGGGTASFSAFRAIKSNDPKAKVLMVTNELRKPYMRPPLSKELWYSAQNGEKVNNFRFKQWTGAERSIFFEPDEFFVDPRKLMDNENGGISVAQGFTVRKVDATKRIITLTDGAEIAYDECLIATGCSPKNLPILSNAPASVTEKVMVYRTPDDFERLKKYADEKKCITIVGNGFIGSELACSLANYAKNSGVKIYQVFPESGSMSKLLPDYLSKWTTRKVEAQGVCVLSNSRITDVKRDDSNLQLKLNNGTTILTDVIVVCVGCEANTRIAMVSGLEVDKSLGGFVVNAELEARRNLFVAGDASCFYDPLLGRRRVEHHDHSVVSGRLAGENMVGKKKAYNHQSMFWSDLGPEIGYEGIGLVDASLPTVGVFALPSKTKVRSDNLEAVQSDSAKNGCLSDKKDSPDIACDPKDAADYGRGVIFYLKDEKIVGVLLWNLFNRIGLARIIINQNKKFADLNEVAKLFEIHS